MSAHRRCKGVRRVHDGRHLMLADPPRQPVDSSEATDADRPHGQSRAGDPACERGREGDPLRLQMGGKIPCLCGPSEDEHVRHAGQNPTGSPPIVTPVDPIIDRLAPAASTPDLAGGPLVVVLVLAGIAAAWWPAWRVLRLVVTLVHELGHAVVGMACGRRFTGFVLRSDMSGHAVTVGPARGAGVIATTWAGYPAPGVVGAAIILLATRGWSAPALTVLVIGLLAALTRVRSALTGLIVIAVIAGAAALWWWRDDSLQQQVLVGAGILLLVGAWRHLGTMLTGIESSSDPGVLARATGVPAAVWLFTFALVLAGATWMAVAQVLDLVRP